MRVHDGIPVGIILVANNARVSMLVRNAPAISIRIRVRGVIIMS